MISRKTSLLAVVKRETERIKHNRAYKFLLLWGPLLGIFVLFFTFHQGAIKNIPIAIVDQDHSALSIKLENYINASPDVMVTMHVHDLFTAKSMLERGEIDAVVLIPNETEKNVFKGIEAPIPLYINGLNVLKASLLQRSLLTTVGTISGGAQLKRLMAEGKTEKEAMTRVMPIKVEKHILFNPYTNYNYFLGSAMVYIILYLFVLLSSTYTLGNELKRGTGKDLLNTSNNSVRIAVLGKLIPYTIIFTGFGMLINLLLYVVDGMPLNGNYVVLFLGQFLTIVTYQLMGLIFIGATSNLRLAMSIVSAYSMMAVTFSGLTFPHGAMPKVAQIFSSIFPFTWWEKLFISQSLRGAPLRESLPYMLYILVFMVVSLAFLKVYKKHLGDPSCWGKS